jgi:hypothetical protein
MDSNARTATYEARWGFAYEKLMNRLMDAAHAGDEAAFTLLKGCWEGNDECLAFLAEQTNRLMAGLAA